MQTRHNCATNNQIHLVMPERQTQNCLYRRPLIQREFCTGLAALLDNGFLLLNSRVLCFFSWIKSAELILNTFRTRNAVSLPPTHSANVTGCNPWCSVNLKLRWGLLLNVQSMAIVHRDKRKTFLLYIIFNGSPLPVR